MTKIRQRTFDVDVNPDGLLPAQNSHSSRIHRAQTIQQRIGIACCRVKLSKHLLKFVYRPLEIG